MICHRARERGMDLLVEASLPQTPPWDRNFRVDGQRILCAATGRLLGMAYNPDDEIPF